MANVKIQIEMGEDVLARVAANLRRMISYDEGDPVLTDSQFVKAWLEQACRDHDYKERRREAELTVAPTDSLLEKP